MKKLLLISVLLFGTFFLAEDTFATANVYYSVGQSSSNLLAGTSVTVTLTSGAAVFDVAQTGNIGVGDRVTYDTDNKVAYIAAKTNADQKHWTLITKSGGTPTDVSAVTVGSIKHEYTSLSAAITGAKDSNHINNADLTVADVALNIPCYYDSGPDTTAVTVSGYTTDATRYIRIYTPNNTVTEANNSQRHQGKWDDKKYNLTVTFTAGQNVINLSQNYTHIDGLQVFLISSTNGITSNGIRIISTSGNAYVSSNIVKASLTNGAMGNGIAGHSSSTGNHYISNNIIYDWLNNSLPLSAIVLYTAGTAYAYNNTVYGSYTGITRQSVNTTAVIKNILSYNNTDNYAGSYDSSSTNNLSSGTDPQMPSTNKIENVAVIFVDAASKDFRLAPTDTGARNSGADLSSDSHLPVTTDIEGQARPTGTNAFDIGADEMNYSVSNLRGVGSTRGYVNYR